MKELNVKKVSLANVAVENVPALLDKEKVDFQSINTVNWKAFPYQPEVQFRIAHTDGAILIHYKVKEASVRAVATGDNRLSFKLIHLTYIIFIYQPGLYIQ